MVTLDGLVALIDGTILNPFLVSLVPPLLHYGFKQPFSVTWPPAGAFALPRVETGPYIKLACFFATVGIVLRWNRRSNQAALNNRMLGSSVVPNKEIALITGGAGGIGAMLAKRLAAKGVTVVVVDVLPLQFVPPKSDRKIHHYTCDITDYDAFEAVVRRIQKEVGHPTLVAANAGIARGKSLLDATRKDIDMTFRVNNIALIWTIKLLIPDMIKRNSGHFLITASATAYTTTAYMVDYSATKAAALSIWEGLQAELAHVYKAPKVRCSVICPSLIKTKMFDGLNNPDNFFAPPLEPDYVAQLMADCLLSGQAQHIFCPSAAGNIVTYLRAWPSWMRVGIQAATYKVASDLKGHDPLALKNSK
ncbi:hypothetical protein BDW75DRAFT_223416 [Aspergillus navahoensis]